MRIEHVQQIGKKEALTVVFYDEERDVRGVKIITRQLDPNDKVACVINVEEEDWKFPQPQDHDYGIFPEDLEMVTLQVTVETTLQAKAEKWCKERQITMELLLRALLYFWVAPENKAIVEKWVREWKLQEEMSRDFGHLKAISQEEFLEGFDQFLDEVSSGNSPIRIKGETHDVLLFGWEDYWNRYAPLFPESEKERVEQLCAEQAESSDNTE